MSFHRHRILLRSALARWTGAALVAAVLVPAGAHQAAAAAATTTLYASPGGNGASCTLDNPCSLAKAQQTVRALVPGMSSDITVDLRGGTYQLSSPLSFTPADSGANGHTVVWQAYPGEKPVFSGGRQVSGWQLYDSGKGIYRAAVPTGTQSRQLFVNGVRAERARSAVNPAGFTVTATGFTTTDPQYLSWSNPAGVEIVHLNAWKELRCPVTAITPAAGGGSAFTLAQPCFGNGGAPPYPSGYFPYNGGGSPGLDSISWIENNYALLSTPGQFYLDSAAGYAYYIPRAGEDLSQADVELPTTQTLVSLAGTPGHLTPVDDTDPSITYTGSSWGYNSGRTYGDLGDDVHYATNNGDAATITFTGTGIEVLSEANSDEGGIDVYVDGVLDRTVTANRTAERLAQQVVYSKTGLSQGTHTVRLVKKDNSYLLIDGYLPVNAPIAPVHDIALRGITFAYATWLGSSGPDGYRDNQAGVTWTGTPAVAGRVGAAVQVSRGRRIEISGGTFSHLGGTAVDLANGTQDSTVSGNRISDTSGSGVSVGEFDDFYLADPALMTSGDTVSDNAISYVGQEYQDCVGILVGNGRNVTLAHNDIGHTPYSGISLGWGWGWASTNGGARHGTIYSQGNAITGNYVHDVMQVLNDGGLVYTLGGQGDGSVHSTFSGNVLSTCTATSAGCHGIYLDEGSSWWDVGGNVVSQPAGNWANMWTPTIHDDTLHDNYSDVTRLYNNGTNVPITTMTYVTDGVWPSGAQSIVAAAGLEPAYKNIAIPEADLVNDGAVGSLLAPGTITYTGSWQSDGGRDYGDLGEDVHATTANGDSVTFSFTGTGIRVLGERNNDQGTLGVTLDGTAAGTVDTSTTGARQVQQPVYQVSNLPYGTHTVVLTKQSGTYATIDGYELDKTIDDTDASLHYSGAWAVSSGRGVGDYGDGVHYTAGTGDSVTATWSGTGVDFVTEKNADEGNIGVYVDGQLRQTVSAATPTRLAQQVVYSINGLTPGVHTIRLVKQSGMFLLVDRFTFR
jgi:hypothetical protein